MRFRILALAAVVAACHDVTGPKATTIDHSGGTVVIAHLDIDPATLSVLTGDTIRLRTIARDDTGGVVSDAAVSWHSTDSTIASISADGTVIALRSGATSVVARAQAVSATASVAVQDVATVEGLRDVTGIPLSLTNLAGVALLDIRIASIAAPVRAATIKTTCGGSSQSFALPAPDAAGLTQGRFPTDSVDAAGHAVFPNGACSLSVVVTTSQGPIRSSPPVAIVLANPSGFVADYAFSGVNAPFGTPFPTSYTSPDNTVWHTGTATLQLVAKSFDARTVTEVSGTFLGKAFDVTNAAAGGRFTITFPNVDGDPSGRSVAGFVSPAGGSVPAITKATFADGTAAFTALQASPVYLDNQAPQAPSTFALPPGNVAIGWIAGAYQFVAAANYTSGGDGSGVGGTSVTGYAGVAQATPPLAGGTATGAACSVGALRTVVTGADALRLLADPSTVTNRSLLARAFETDRLGNVRCTDLSTGVFGVDVVPPTVVRAPTATRDSTVLPFTQTYQTIRFDVIASDGQSGLEDPHHVHRSTIGYTAGGAFCFYGCSTLVVAPDTLSLDGGGRRWVDQVVAVDRVGNQSQPLVTNVIDGSFDIAPVSWGGFPAVFVGGSTFTLTVSTSSGLGLSRVSLGMDYSYSPSNMVIEVAADTVRDPWDLNLLGTWTGPLTIHDFMRQLEIVDGNDAPYADTASYIRAYGIIAGVANIAGEGQEQFYGLGDKNMPLGFTYFGKGIQQFRMTTPASTVSNVGASTSTVSLSAAVTTDLAAAAPFDTVCFYYRYATNASGTFWRPAGCTSSGVATATATSRTLAYQVTFNPPPTLGTSGALVIRAIGMNATGDGLSTNSSSAVTLVP